VSDEEYTKRATDLALNEYGCEDLAEFEAKYNKATIYQAILMDMVAEKIVELADITITDSAINFN